MKIYTCQSKQVHNSHLHSTALCTAIKLCIMRPSLTHIVWNCSVLPRRTYGTVLETNDVPRVSQMLMTFINSAMLNALISLKSPYMTYLTSPPRSHNDGGENDDYTDIFTCDSVQLQRTNTKPLSSMIKSNSNLNNNNNNVNRRAVSNSVFSTVV